MSRVTRQPAPWRRDLLIQIAILLAVVGLGAWMAATAAANLQARGLAAGFGFLARPSGFDIAQTLVPYGPTDSHARVFLVGALNTLLVAVLGVVLATVFGVAAGVARGSSSLALRGAATVYVEAARNTPLPIQLLIWYSLVTAAPPPRAALALPGGAWLTNRGLHLPTIVWSWPTPWVLAAFTACALVGVGGAWLLGRRRRVEGHGPSPWLAVAVAAGAMAVAWTAAHGRPEPPRLEGFGFTGGATVSPPLVSLVLALTVYTGGYIAEVVRGGLEAAPRGQWEAARALGLRNGAVLGRVVLPQALRIIAPPLVSQYLNLLKNSSLAVVVGYPDLVATFGGTSLNQTGQAIETLGLVLAFYLVVCLGLSAGVNAWSRRQARWADAR